jgi:uncharacterized protein
MKSPIIGTCTLELYLAGVTSLKEKRSILKSLLARLHNTFNLSAAEIDANDRWQSAVIAIAVVSNETAHANDIIHTAIRWIERHFPDVEISQQTIEIL